MTSVFDSLRMRLRATDNNHRVTTLELFFDLVFVYAITNVTALMEHDISGVTVLEGLITLALVWFGWCAYTWLGNQAKADEGLLRLAMIVAMAGMFFVAISIPFAFETGSDAAVVLVVAYAVVRLTHLAVYLVAAGDDAGLRSVIFAMLGVATTMLVILAIGAAVGGEAQKWWWLGAVLVDQLGVYFVRSTRWVVHSAPHFAERFGLIIIIAIGESVIAVGASTASADLAARDIVALLCGLAVAVCLWWLYFDVVALVAEEVLRGSSGVARARLARDSYTYIHLPMVAGIVFAALGLVFLINEEHVAAGRYALYGGIACYLGAHLLFRLRNVGSINVPRAIVAAALLVGLATLGTTRPLVQLVVAAGVLVALVSYEVSAFREPRSRVRAAGRSG